MVPPLVKGSKNNYYAWINQVYLYQYGPGIRTFEEVTGLPDSLQRRKKWYIYNISEKLLSFDSQMLSLCNKSLFISPLLFHKKYSINRVIVVKKAKGAIWWKIHHGFCRTKIDTQGSGCFQHGQYIEVINFVCNPTSDNALASLQLAHTPCLSVYQSSRIIEIARICARHTHT